MSVSFGKFQDSSDSRQSAKLNLAPFKLKTAPFRVNLPKSFIWSDPKFSEADGKTPAAFSLPQSALWSTLEPLFCCVQTDRQTEIPDPASINPLSPPQQHCTLWLQFISALLHSCFSSCLSSSNASG